MSIYGIIVLIHVIAAVCGLGATFALPILMNRPKTVSQAHFAFHVNDGIEKLAKVGSIILLVTGILLGILNPDLFTKVWYIASLIIYVAVQPIVAVILPKRMAEQKAILENHSGEELPESYLQIGKKMAPYNGFLHSSAIILIVLMVLKPF
ncbi:DUF2269 family protein [Bacillus sp. FJAT-42376]|uniref:DUF2269 family protein n=1 Tax=Bacillus sp. FJAT-42376 TaxID=2014076 RepID=UPI000F5136F9|nr:DUF2269 family protein [Bacillus sp. FJAT-42376]AZB41830.1 DUF2269 family protein [Bacillus sp. FJAT-42376]